MERCDFSYVATTIKNYISEDNNLNQSDFLDELFYSFYFSFDEEAAVFDYGLICRWINGQAKISPRISSYYLKKENRKKLTDDIRQRVLPLMYDSAMAIQEIYNVLVQDTSVSDKVKSQLCMKYPCINDGAEAEFLSEVLCFSMERKFVKRDAKTQKQLTAGVLSPIIKDFVYNGVVPNPCRYFCGREREIEQLHKLLLENDKVFLQGIPGIGKSEVAKGYAKQYKKEYTNELYIEYTGSLKQDIADMDFADDIIEEDEERRFCRHNRFLSRLNEDTLIIIDNFNTTATEDTFLHEILKYRCKILFTTRSRFDNYTSMELEEITDKNVLLELMGAFYSNAEQEKAVLSDIIDAVHSHTFAVELAARLLETGILKPEALLKKFQEEKAGMDSEDKIGVKKDGKSHKATYYVHIHTLFSLYSLSEEELNLLKNLCLMPLTGIHARLLAEWLGLSNLNTVNDLVEKGFVKSSYGLTVSLHPMIQEVALDETKPSVSNSIVLIHNLHNICICHGIEVPYYKKLFETIENIISLVIKDEREIYLRFLEDVFPYMQKYQYENGLRVTLDEIDTLLKDSTLGTVSDRALLWDFRASNEKNLEKAINLEKKAVKFLPALTADSALLTSNIYSNLGGLYHQHNNLELAQKYMKDAIDISIQYGFTEYNDSVAQVANYASLLADLGQHDKALASLKRAAKIVREKNSDTSDDYGCIQEVIGYIYLSKGDIEQATVYFRKAIKIFKAIYGQNSKIVEEKLNTMKESLIQVLTKPCKQIIFITNKDVSFP